MKFEDYKQQVLTAVRKAMQEEHKDYIALMNEEPESEYEYRLQLTANITGVAKGAWALVDISDYSYNQKEQLKKAISKLQPEYKKY